MIFKNLSALCPAKIQKVVHLFHNGRKYKSCPLSLSKVGHYLSTLITWYKKMFIKSCDIKKCKIRENDF